MTTSRCTHDANEETVAQAAEWMLELQSADVSVERIAAWQQWLSLDRRHARAFEELQQTSNFIDRQLMLSNRETLPWPTADELAETLPSRPLRVSSAKSRKVRRPLVLMAAAVMLAVVGSGFWLSARQNILLIETPVRGHRDIRLSDGSSVSVGAGSQLSVSMQQDIRVLELRRGEAFFQVAKDSRRPFVVRSGSTSVTALGTAFNVRRTGESVTVGVSEGVVAITPERESWLKYVGLPNREKPRIETAARLEAGQRLAIMGFRSAPPRSRSANAGIESVPKESVGSWRHGRLQYSGEPLSFVVQDVNRYSRRPIVIVDRSIESLRVTGAVSEENVETWLSSLQQALPVKVRTGDDGQLEISAR